MKKIILSFLITGYGLLITGGAMADDLPANAKIDKIVVNKSDREMIVFQNGTKLKTYKVALGTNPVGHKQFQGDGKTPEGIYKVDGKNPHSRYHKNLGVSYPNSADKSYAASQNKSAGGDIKIHGLGKYFRYLGAIHYKYDWTIGCIAVTDDEIDEIYAATAVGTTIEINP